MSKIICDICGTSYAETAKQCPICGSVRPGDVQRMTNEVKSDGNVSTGYTYVKGGRFSKGNVKKRNHTQARNSGSAKKPAPKKQNAPEEKDNRGLVITAIILLLAVIGVVIYIAVRFFGPISDPNPEGSVNQGQQAQIACTAINLDVSWLSFEEANAVHLLNVKLEPANTSDSVKFLSENESVVKVNNVGKVTVVGEGSTNIVITCGKITKKLPVTVAFNATTGSENSENTTGSEAPTVSDGTVRLNRKDMTLSQKGGTWMLYSGDVAKNLVTFTSEDESVVTFVDGVVTAVGSNYDGVWVHAEYNGQKASCLVRCSFSDNSGVTGNGGVTEDGGGSGTTSAKGTVTADEINVRSGPGTSNADIGDLYQGDRVTITERKHDGQYEWGKITYGDGFGWIALQYVKLD